MHKSSKGFFKKPNILSIIRNYTREAGVRNLEREISKVARKTVKKILTNENEKDGVQIDSKNYFLLPT